MNKGKFPFLLMDQNKSNNDEESDFSDPKIRKYRINKFEKFKPKKSDVQKSQIYLKGAESNLKSMLNIFLKDIEQEEKINDIKKNNLNKKTQVEANKFKRREEKRNSATSLKLNFGKSSKNDKNKNFNYKNQINNNVKRLNNKKRNTYFHRNEAIKNNNTNKMKNISNATSTESDISALKKIKRTNSSNSNLESVSIMSNGNRMNSLNDSNYNLLLPNENNKQRIKAFNNNSNSFMSESISSISPSHKMNVIKNTLDNKKIISSFANEKNNLKNLNINEHINKNNDNTPKRVKFKNANNNNIINDSKKPNAEVLNEDSYNTLDSRDDLNKKNSKTLEDEFIRLMSYKSAKEINKTKGAFHHNSGKNNSKFNSELGDNPHPKTQRSEQKNEFINKKYFKKNSQFKSIQKKLRKAISLRPEYISNKKNIRKNRSNIDLPHMHINKNLMNIEKINKKDLEKINKSSTANVKVILPKLQRPKTKKSVDRKRSIENNSSNQVTLKKITSLKHKNAVITPKYRLLRRKANLYDSLDDEEFEDAEEINNFFIHPNSNFILIFDFLLLIFSGFIAFVIVPFYLAKTHYFCRKKNFLDISLAFIIIEALNILDLLISFFRGYYNWEEQLIYRKRMIIKNYLSGWFLFDLISALPIYTFNKFNEPMCNDFVYSTIYYNTVLNVPHYLLLCNKIFKLLKIFYKNQAWKIISNHLNDSASMIINICLVLLALNYAGSLYIFIARNSYPNWILNSNLDTSSFLDIYICSIYILIMAITTVGYGDITCYSFRERVFQILLLVVGILAYSWVVTSFSNYIKKINEKSADYQNKKEILDEIKLNNQNMPDNLYEKILRHLKFKNFHEKKLKNIIFDCLPVSLKNSLIIEMYKPIINNFIFFRNFQNTDFIVSVILVFRPIIAGKNDILINDSDMVEDIMFVKKGVLSVELPINMSNPQENIDKYFNMSLEPGKEQELTGTGNTSNMFSKFNNNNNNLKNNIGNFFDNSKNNSNYKKSAYNSNVFGSGFELNNKSSFANNRSIIENEKKKEEDIIRYVKILCIRNNEHFGDVMMFLEKRSPLRVRVKSKKAELYFLKKMDAIKISTNYPNIWRRINKKSIFNFKQITKSIHRIVELYCSVKKLYSIEEESSDSIYGELIKQKNIVKEDTAINLRPKEYVLNKINTNGVNTIKKCHSFQNVNTSSLKRIMIKHNLEMLSTKNLDNKFSNSSVKIRNNIKLRLNSLAKSSSLRKKRRKQGLKINSKKRVKFETTTKADKFETIKEDISKEDAYSKLKSTNSFKNISKMTVSTHNMRYKFSCIESNLKSTNVNMDNQNIINNAINNDNNNNDSDNSKNNNDSKNNDDNKSNNDNNNNYKKFLSKNNRNKINTIIKKTMKTLKLDDSSSLQLINDENFDSIGRDEGNQSNALYNKLINDEIYPGEEIEINKDESLLLQKKFDNVYPIKKEIPTNDNNNKYSNGKLQYLLKYLDENNEANKNTNINSNSINSNNINEYIIKKNDSNFLPDTQICVKKNVWEKNSLIISNNISFKYHSSYDNCNILCGGKLVGNKLNQFKLKKILREEFLFQDSDFRRQSIDPRSYNNNKMNININSNLKRSIKGKSESPLKNNIQSPFLKQSRKKIKKITPFSCKTLVVNNSTRNKQKIQRTQSFNNILTEGNKLIKQDDTHLSWRKNITFSNKNFLSTKNVRKYSHLMRGSNEKSRKKLVNSLLSPKNKPKKKKDGLLSKINSNIRKTNLNLNNPDEFYSNYFNSIMNGIPKRDKGNNFMKNFIQKK